LCEKECKEDSASTGEALSPHFETFLSTEIRLRGVSTSQSISKIFKLVKGSISNFSTFHILSGNISLILRLFLATQSAANSRAAKKIKKLDILPLTNEGEVYIVEQGGTVCLTIALPRRCLSLPLSST